MGRKAVKPLRIAAWHADSLSIVVRIRLARRRAYAMFVMRTLCAISSHDVRIKESQIERGLLSDGGVDVDSEGSLGATFCTTHEADVLAL